MGVNDTFRRRISDYWKKWENVGLGTSSVPSRGGSRFKYSFKLEDFGIKSPEITQFTSTNSSTQTENKSEGAKQNG